MSHPRPAPAVAGMMISRPVFALVFLTAMAGFVLPGIWLHAETANSAMPACAAPAPQAPLLSATAAATSGVAYASPTALLTSGALIASQTPAPESAPPAGVTLTLNTPQAPVDPGASFQVPITVTGATDVISVTLIFDYDVTKLALQSISPGDFLNRDGERPRLMHSDSPLGHVVISMSRPPGDAGLSGDGTVCVLNFGAVNSGASDLTIKRATVVNSAQQVVRAKFVQPSVVVK